MENKPNNEPSNPQQQVAISDASVDKIVELVRTLYEKNLEIKREERLTLREVNRDKLKTVRQLDIWQTVYKGIVVILCIVALGYLALDDKLLGVSPVLGVIIGAVLGSDSVTQFLLRFRREVPDEE